MKHIVFTLLVLAGIASSNALFAQGKIDLQQNDTMRAVLERQVGQVVDLRLKSGEKIAGKLEKVTETLAHLAQLTGAEFYDAAVDLNEIAAVSVRTKTK